MKWRSMASRAAGMTEAEWRVRGRRSAGGGRERGGNPPQRRIGAAPAWAVAAIGSDQRLRALHSERGHRVMTRSVVSGLRVVRNRCEPLAGGPGPVTNFLSNFQFSSNL
jgi:hypothetical protein